MQPVSQSACGSPLPDIRHNSALGSRQISLRLATRCRASQMAMTSNDRHLAECHCNSRSDMGSAMKNPLLFCRYQPIEIFALSCEGRRQPLIFSCCKYKSTAVQGQTQIHICINTLYTGLQFDVLLGFANDSDLAQKNAVTYFIVVSLDMNLNCLT